LRDASNSYNLFTKACFVPTIGFELWIPDIEDESVASRFTSELPINLIERKISGKHVLVKGNNRHLQRINPIYVPQHFLPVIINYNYPLSYNLYALYSGDR
jgi:hypothetical protein